MKLGHAWQVAVLAVALGAPGAWAADAAQGSGARAGTGAVEAQIMKLFGERFPQSKVETVTRTGFSGLYEIYAGGEIYYTDDKLSWVLDGSLIDVNSKKNVTEERMEQLSFVKFADLPFDAAIKQVRGDGSRKIAIFEDPNCGYCKQFRRTLGGVDNITIYTFVLPILAADSATKAKQIWCASDRGKAWDDWMLNGRLPLSAPVCDAPIERVLAFAQKYRIRGTPAIFFADNSRVPGAMPADALKVKLAAQPKS